MNTPMNMLRNLALLAGFLFILIPAEAQSPRQAHGIDLDPAGNKKVALRIQHPGGGATVRIFDEAGEVLFEDEVDEDAASYRKLINLERLPAGKYQLFVGLPQRELHQQLLITPEDRVVLRPEDREVYLLPTISLGEEKVDVHWFSREEARVRVLVQRANGEVIFEEELEDVSRLQRRYNLEQLPMGNYVMVVKTPHDTYYRRVMVD